MSTHSVSTSDFNASSSLLRALGCIALLLCGKGSDKFQWAGGCHAIDEDEVLRVRALAGGIELIGDDALVFKGGVLAEEVGE
jgi:hypothetical protein